MTAQPQPLPDHERRLLEALAPVVERLVREEREKALAEAKAEKERSS